MTNNNFMFVFTNRFKNNFFIIFLICFCNIFNSNIYARSSDSQFIDSLVKQLPKLKDDTLKVKVLNTISSTYNSINPDEGISYGKKGLELTEKLGWKKGKAWAFNAIATNYEVQSKHSVAIENFTKALTIYESQNNKEGMSISKEYLGNVFRTQGELTKALRYYNEALKLNKEIDDQYSIARNLGNIALVYFELGEFEKTLNYQNKAIAVHKKFGDNNALALDYVNLANIFNARGSFDSANLYENKALSIFEASDNINGKSVVYINIGEIYKNKKDFRNALKFYQQALKLSLQIGNKQNVYSAYGNIGETYLLLAEENESDKNISDANDAIEPFDKDSRLDKAVENLNKAKSGCKEINDKIGMIEFSKFLSEAYSQKGNFTKALELLKEYTNLKDSVFSITKVKEISNIESSKQLEEIYDKQILLSKLASARNRNETIILYLGLMALLVVVTILLVNNSNQNKLISMYKQEIQNLSAKK